MSQEIMNHKRRWLKRILDVGKPRTWWIAPALLTPLALTGPALPTAHAQQPVANRSISDGEVRVDAEYVIGWLDAAAKRADSGDLGASATAFAEAIRGWRQLPAEDQRVQSRLTRVQQQLLDKGMRLKDVEQARDALGPMRPVPTVTSGQPKTSDKAAQEPEASPLDRRDQAAALTAAAAQAIEAGDRAKAQQLIARAEQLNVPDAWMLPGHTTLTEAKSRLGVVAAAGSEPAGQQPNRAFPPLPGAIAPGVYKPAEDSTSNQPASTEIRLAQSTGRDAPADGEQLYRNGIQLLSEGKRDEALAEFRRAWEFQGEIDPAIRAQLKDKLTNLQAASLSSKSDAANNPQLQQLDKEQLEMRQRMMSEVTGEIAAAEANRELEPKVVEERLQTLRRRVSQANLDGDSRKRMLTIVDRAISAHENYMSQNKAAIEQNMKNSQVLDQLALKQEERTKTDQQIASLVEQYNDLMDSGSFLEAESIAKQVGSLDPNSEIARLLIINARNARRIGEYERIRQMKEDGFIDNMMTVDMAAIPADDREPLVFGDVEEWEQLTKRRREGLVRESRQGMSPAETRIWDRLTTPVLVNFKDRPLGEVIQSLSDITDVMMHIDKAGLAQENVSPETPVTLSLPSEITLRSALNLLLNTQNLDYQIRDEVLLITSASNKASANVQRVYSVKDLVQPIPNFVTDGNSGMAGALRQAYENVGRSLAARTNGQPMGGNMQFASSSSLDPNSPALGQLNNGLPGGMFPGGGMMPGGLGGGFGVNPGMGPTMGGMMGSAMGGSPMQMGAPGAMGGGGAMADFDTLMNLIQQTIDPDSWLAAGGNSSILPYPSNLSLVVSAPQTTHEKVADLLESLRRLQDLQVTIEVKFITLNDNFFERIGVDFDVRVDDGVRQLPNDDGGPSTVVGLSSNVSAADPFPFTSDFDITFSQNSFASAVPAFGGFDDASGANIGFAILSDLEMFFFMNAAQGDQRTNVLQAPRVTMFDGQFATINDTVQRPFVTSVTPVVADFAVAQQPIIVVLNEGTVLNVQATVSPDKRYVRMTLNPSFSQIDRVDTFTFEGSRTSSSGTNVLDPDGNPTGDVDDEEEITSGTTVQQPSFANTSISTTVTVPDGGTILLGGIKRMREGRLERGVPILSKIPYVNRLFKNTAIGRETSTLMMTVTPRIIIQEEEEQKVGIPPS